MPGWRAISEQLESQHGIVADTSTLRPVGGGDINQAWCLHTDTGKLFLKTATSDRYDMFNAEAEGLRELANADAVRVPGVVACEVTGNDAWIALEWLDISAASSRHHAELGRQLADQHRVTREQHGWHIDNTIGLTPQPNSPCEDWASFFAEHRLQHQLQLAEARGFGGDLQRDGRRLVDSLERIFDGYEPAASLLHGDLWGGNWAVVDDEPVIFDPAVYFGDRENDLAMTRLFGGFSRHFYAAYEEQWPLADGHERRLPLYQLYHVLNHLNLFGSGYLGRSLELIRSLV